jgi:alpha-L-rhamnosidase
MRNLIILACLSLLFASCQPQKETPKVADLRCEYLENPLGIDVANPRLFWKMEKPGRGAMQTAYRILAASSAELLAKDSADLWDSGVVESNRSIQVEYAGKPLKSGDEVYWRVKIRDENKVESNWSETARWEMGIMNQLEWQAKWTGAPTELFTGDLKNASPLFRKKFTVSGKIKKARVYISGLGYYELYLNSQKVGDHVLSPNQTNFDRRQLEKWSDARIGNMKTTVLYETHDITSALKEGENVAGVILGNGWYLQADRPENPQYLFDSPRMLAQIKIDYEDGRTEWILSDDSWKTAVSPILYNGLHSGEIYDARLEQNGWDKPGFDDSAWVNAELVRPPTGVLKAQASPPDRVTKTIKPVSVSQPEKGIYRYDLGQMISGWARIKISGEKGTKIKLVFTEEFGPTYGQTDTYILKGEGVETWEPRFTWHAFRYVDVFGSPQELTLENLEGQVVNTDVSQAGIFECSNELFNRILENYRWTQLGNLHGGVPSDCPHRERRGYTGDGQISARSAIYSFNMAPFYTKWVGDISDAQNQQNGYVPNTTPYDDGGGGTPWGAAYVIIPWYMYQYYGDVSILKNHYTGMKHWIDFMENSLDNRGILVNQGLGEWVPPDIVEVHPDYVNTCYYFWCCKLMTNVAELLNQPEDKNRFATLAQKAAEDMYKVYFDNEKTVFSVGRQGANAYPLGFGFANENSKKALFGKLVENVESNNLHFDTGILGTPILLEVLTELGRVDLAYTLMNQRDYPSFGYMIEKGATTIWETFQGDVSHSHPMFGSVTQWFYQHLGGIVPDPSQPGFKHTIIKPFPVSGLEFAKTCYPSIYGEIKTNWSFSGDDFNLEVSVPANTTATVFVPAESDEKVTESGKSVTGKNFVKFLRMDGQFAVFEVASGDYSFCSTGAKNMLMKTILPAPVIQPEKQTACTGDSVKVVISSGVKDATIFYTTNGTEPDSASIFYKEPFFITNTAEIKARSMKMGFGTSYVQTCKLNFIDPEKNGINYDYFEGKWMKLPDYRKLPVVKSGTVFEFGLEKIIPTKDEFGISFHGFLQIVEPGDYEFIIRSNDGTILYLDNKPVINHDGPHGADIEKSGKIKLEAGKHPVKLDYFQAGGGLFLQLEYAGPGVQRQIIPPQVLYRK